MTDVLDITSIVGITAGRNLLSDAIAYALGRQYVGSGNWLDATGHGHDAAFGPTTHAPLFLTNAVLGTRLYLPGVAGNNANVPNAANLHITGDIDIRHALAMTDWTPTTYNNLACRYQAANHSFFFGIDTGSDGLLFLNWSEDGATDKISYSTVKPTVVDGALLLIRVTLDVDNGASGNTVTFYTKASTVATQFADLRAHTGWTVLGAPVVTTATTSIFAGTALLEIGYGTGSGFPITGDVFGFVLLDGIAGTEVVAIDFTKINSYNNQRTSLTATTGQTVTISRPTAGRKTVAVDIPKFLLGTDDYFEIPDDPALNFGLADSFTIAIGVTQHATPVSSGRYLAKQNGSAATALGYSIETNGTALAPKGTIGDGTTGITATGPTYSAGVRTLIILRRRAGVDLTMYTNGVAGTPVADTLAGTLLNTNVLRLGARSDSVATFQDCVIDSYAIFGSALTDDQIMNTLPDVMGFL